MRQVQAFPNLNAALQHRLTRLESLARDAQYADDPFKRRTASYVSIELHNCWAGFARSSYLSVMCGARTLGGALALPSRGVAPTPAEALQRAIAHVRPPTSTSNKEPHWFNVSIYTRLASHFGFVNLASITAALAYPTDFFRLAPTFRNFFAHKNEGTAAKVEGVRQQDFPNGPRCPSKLLIEVFDPSRPPILLEWIHDAKVIGQLILQ